MPRKTPKKLPGRLGLIPPGEADYVLDLDKTDFGLLPVFFSYSIELIHAIVKRLPQHARLHVRYRNADLLSHYLYGFSDLGGRVIVHMTTTVTT